MKLVEGWASHWWKFWSVRLAMVAGLAAGYLAAYPDELKTLIAYVPEKWRPLVSMAIGLFVFASATGSRLVVQKKLPGAGDTP